MPGWTWEWRTNWTENLVRHATPILRRKKELHALTGFRPQTSLTEIIDRVAAYYRQKEEPFAAVAAAKAPD